MQLEMKSIISNAFRKRAYYREHPEESHEDRMRAIALKSDDFIMEKVKRWEEEKRLK